jgi:hypothetical protein
VADGLSQLINRKIQEDSLKPLRICRGAPGVSHLLFADDTLLFFQASEEQAMHVKEVLHQYERGTGQLINAAKCSIMFNPKGNVAEQEGVANIMQVQVTGFEAKYLGLPTARGRQKKGKFQSIKERSSKRLTDYSEKCMSAAAKEVLIKSVAQALPTYIMSVFQLPLTLCDELTGMIREFWWGTEKGKKKMAWLAWDKLTLKSAEAASASRISVYLIKHCLLGRPGV